MSTSRRKTHTPTDWMALIGYAAAGLIIFAGWRLSDENYINAGSGVGYALGILGATLMGLLLLYPLRKRLKKLNSLGPVRHWFRVHMIFGIVGPLLIILHSNFNLGSFNGRVALFCTIVVASSGIVGRYLYAKIHHGLYGRRLTLEQMRQDLDDMSQRSQVSQLFPLLHQRLKEIEAVYLNASNGVLTTLCMAVIAEFHTRWARWQLRQLIRQRVQTIAARSPVVRSRKDQLAHAANRYMTTRFSLLRRYAQFRASERLFSLWHIVHYPLFLIMILAVLVHILAVHMY